MNDSVAHETAVLATGATRRLAAFALAYRAYLDLSDHDDQTNVSPDAHQRRTMDAWGRVMAAYLALSEEWTAIERMTESGR